MHPNTYKPAPSVPWSMVRGDVQFICPEAAGVLRVTSGRAWVTLNPATEFPPPRWCPDIEPGDIFMGPGRGLTLHARQRVLIESWPVGSGKSSDLIWEDAKAHQGNDRWQDAVLQSASRVVRSAKQLAVALRIQRIPNQH
ncbi:DUF2917 domain-containing protein [Rhodoferax lacus]|nr:DUF2917 domain-containing protein [Rhodoferax lacus]